MVLESPSVLRSHPFEDILFQSMPDLLSHFIIVFASEILDALNLILFACVNKSLKVDWTPWSLSYLRCVSYNPCVPERGSWSFTCIGMTVSDGNYAELDMFPIS